MTYIIYRCVLITHLDAVQQRNVNNVVQVYRARAVGERSENRRELRSHIKPKSRKTILVSRIRRDQRRSL